LETVTIYNATENSYNISVRHVFTYYETEEIDSDHMKTGTLGIYGNGEAESETWTHDIDMPTPTHLNESETEIPAYDDFVKIRMV
jgi:hypothetical protein